MTDLYRLSRRQKREERSQSGAENQKQTDLGLVLSSPGGRRFFHDVVFAVCRADEAQIPNGPDGLQFLGRRAVGCELRALALRHHRNLYRQMEAEADDALLREQPPENGEEADL